MDRIIFTENWQDLFARHDLLSFDRLFAHCAPDWMHTKKRVASPFTLDGKDFYIKRFLRPHFKDMITTSLAAGRSCTQARYEFDSANHLLANNIGTYKPVCLGERTLGPIERRSFFVTECLPSVPISQFVKENFPRFTPQQKQNLIEQTARFVRRIHDCRINFPDLYVWHIYVAETDNGRGAPTPSYDFDIIDLHRMTTNVTNRSKQIENLGRLEYSMLDEYFDDNLRRTFVETYAENDPPETIEKLTTAIRKTSAALLKRRNQKPY